MGQETPAGLNIIAVAERMQHEFGHYAPVIARGLAMLNSMSLGIQAVAQEVLPKLGPHLYALGEIDWAEAIRRVQELPAKSKAAMTLAAANGWFFGWSDSLQGVMELVDKLDVDRAPEIDEVMAQYYRKNLQYFADELVNRHPGRAPAIAAAIHAHGTLGVNGYFLSIPVFIAQADGLLTEITKVKSALMKERRGQPELQASVALREQLATDQDSLDLIHPLLGLHELDFMKSADARRSAAEASGYAFTALNRHQVMHGESSDYGTETNSLKAFSLLAFVGTHLPEILQRERSNTTPA
ncbi:hypothetical protein EN871_32570 [bacterium M00.F.Ca.ET.228.01.1.1]|nr:hypothetical protein EN871_32570 [bacterium M00.F.Ca.ET.228.01.1.1]TGR95194.1 hypothetical protein EN834_32555 [bacterium M00.F.Ca.ET.191.01.1.1]TGT95991.1 hypothetical protein EN798_32565 [bacterium M00.F.Ca.ET.155.01.1.1]